MSIKYYDDKAKDFFESTVDVDIQDLYDRFEEHMIPSGRVLDAGCGSGRDTKYFLEKGYTVDAFDASVELVSLASKYTGIKVKKMFFQDLDAINKYDGIWACASLLHVPKKEIDTIFKKFIKALKPNGIWYMSFKMGEQERIKDSRFFNDYTMGDLQNLLESFNEDLSVEDLWITIDARPDRDEYWVNALVTRLALSIN